MGYVMHVDIIASNERGMTQTEWLESKHTYSFGRYHNLQRLNFGTLRVFNDDLIQPGKGFDTHPHENMEIVTLVLSGNLEHKDSKGNRGVLKAGDVQRMSAGTGIKHSEWNISNKDPLRLLQIWIYPKERDLPPSYEQRNFSPESLRNGFKTIVSERPSGTALSIHQDATFYLGHFDSNQTVFHGIRNPNHGVYLFLIEGQISLGEKLLKGGDSAQITKADSFEIKTLSFSKILLIEVNVNTL